jgi:hypothetical protein
MDFYTLACDRSEGAPCGVDDWVANLPNVFPASLISDTVWGFAVVQAFHLLGLGLMGGAVILMNLRFFGVGLKEDPMPELERNLRPWLYIGFGLVIVSGIIIGMLNPDKLYTSPAFFAKMIAMLSAMVFSFYVTSAVAKNNGATSLPVTIAAVVSLLLWLWSMGIFTGAETTNTGTFHMITMGYVILLIYARNLTRYITVGALAVLLLVYVIYGYLVLGGPYGYKELADGEIVDNYAAFIELAKWVVRISGFGLVALFAYEIGTRAQGDTSRFIRMIGLVSILAWVTVAAAGRWIGLS